MEQTRQAFASGVDGLVLKVQPASVLLATIAHLAKSDKEVVRLVSEGLSNKDIADRLCISNITVRHHLTSIFDKLGVSNRQKLLIRAHKDGLTRPPALA